MTIRAGTTRSGSRYKPKNKITIENLNPNVLRLIDVFVQQKERDEQSFGKSYAKRIKAYFNSGQGARGLGGLVGKKGKRSKTGKRTASLAVSKSLRSQLRKPSGRTYRSAVRSALPLMTSAMKKQRKKRESRFTSSKMDPYFSVATTRNALENAYS